MSDPPMDPRITIALDAETLGAIRDLTAALRALARRGRRGQPAEAAEAAMLRFMVTPGLAEIFGQPAGTVAEVPVLPSAGSAAGRRRSAP